MADDATTIEPVKLSDLTTAVVGGTGVFDVLMKAMAANVQLEFDKQRIKAQDYAQVYLSGMANVAQIAVQFLLQKDKAALDAQLVAEQIELAKVELQIQQVKLEQEELNKELITAQTNKLIRETALIDSQEEQIKSQTAMITKQTENLTNQDLLVAKQILKTDAETANTITQNDQILAEICLLKGQFDLVVVQKLQTTAQTSLVQQKLATEKAQTVETGVDDNSVIGKQKLLYAAQTDGFKRDAEQKAAKMLIDTWSVRRTTDDGTVADDTNLLNDATIGRAVTVVLAGVGA